QYQRLRLPMKSKTASPASSRRNKLIMAQDSFAGTRPRPSAAGPGGGRVGAGARWAAAGWAATRCTDPRPETRGDMNALLRAHRVKHRGGEREKLTQERDG